MRFAFVGLGRMGRPMARNLAKAADVVAFDARPKAATEFSQVARAPKDIADVDAVILSLPGYREIEELLFSNGVAAGLRPGTVVVDTGTTDVSDTQDLARRLEGLGLVFLDAPVSGMQSRAEAGTLTMMVGGEAAVLDRLSPSLGAMAETILHMGTTGAGQAAKLVNQLLFDINIAALAEVMPMAVSLGLDPQAIARVVNSGTGRSWASEFFLPRILAGDFTQGYPLEAAYKDIVSGARLTAAHQFPAPVLAAASATYQQALREGHGAKDKGAMILVYERLLGVSFRTALEN